MIILEGPDGAGKTTLAERLCELLAVPVYRIGGTPGSIFRTRSHCELCLERAAERCIQDRVTMISERIYSEIFERESLAHDEFDDFTHRLIDADPLIIYARVDNLDRVDPVVEEYETTEYVEQVKQRMPRIRREYDRLFFQSDMFEPHIRRGGLVLYDFTMDSFEQLSKRVSDRLSRSA